MGERYLQLTHMGIESYNPEDEIIFLNKRCLSYKEIYEFENLKWSCLDFPEELLNEENLLFIWNDFFHRIWLGLAPVLSQIHRVEHGVKYWEYLSSFDLPVLLILYYERYTSIKRAIKLYPNVKIKLFVSDDFYLANNKIWDFRNLDILVQVIDRQILEFINYSNTEKHFFEKEKILTQNKNRIEAFNKKERIRQNVHGLYKKLTRKAPFVITYAFDKNVNILRLKLLNKAYFAASKIPDYKPRRAIDVERRKRLFSEISITTVNEFENIFVYNLWKNFSTIWIEDYKYLLEASKPLYKINTKYYIKRFYEEPKMEYASYLVEKEKVVINCAHSIEESFRLFQSKTDELSKYTLQWSKEKYFAKDNSLECISNMLSDTYNINYSTNQKILYVFSCEFGRHDYSIHGLLLRKTNEREFVRKSADFYLNLSSHVKKHFIFRNRDEWNWGVQDYLKSICGNINIDDSFRKKGGTNFVNILNRSRIVICETVHSTVFFQVLLYDIPVIIIDNVDYEGLLSPEFLSLMQLLKEVDIWVSTPEKASQIVNDNYFSIEKWWNKLHRKEVIRKIRNEIWSQLDGKTGSQWWRDKMEEIENKSEECV